MAGRLLIVHGGGPTAVLNCSLYGAVETALAHRAVDGTWCALGGMGGLLAERFLSMDSVPASERAKLPQTPGSAIGSSRDALGAADYQKIAEALKRHDIRYVLAAGGNGTMDTCGKIYAAAAALGYEISVAGIPKTMDNDLAVTDHAPGFPSAARYMAATVQEICADVRSLPIHVCVVEAMGRNAGWVTAAAALAKLGETGGPDLVYPPETDFDEDDFLGRVEKLFARGRGVVAVVSEGLHGPGGQPLVPPIFQTGRSTYFGDVSAHLAQLVVRKLGLKARGEKPGLAGRCSIALRSEVDVAEARECGAAAARAVIDGETGVMVALRRRPGKKYRAETFLTPIQDVMLTEKTMPPEFLAAPGEGPTPAYLAYLAPLLGGPLPGMRLFTR